MDATDELFTILNKCRTWNDSYKNRIQSCIDRGANLTGIHPRRRFTALLYGLFLELHPDSIRLLASKGYDLNFKVEWTEYIYDDYLGIDHVIKQTASIKNFILAAYYTSIGEHIEDHLLVEVIDQCSHCNIWSQQLVKDLDYNPVCPVCVRLTGL